MATPELFTFEVETEDDGVGISPRLRSFEIEATSTDQPAVTPRLRTFEIEAFLGEATITLGIDGKQLKNGTVTPAKLSFTPAEDGNLAWRQPVAVRHLVGNLTIAGINGLSPLQGDAYVATDAGTPTAGTSDALVAGSIAEYDGTSWKEIVAGSGGFVPADTRAIISSQTTPSSPYNSGSIGLVVDFSGASLSGVSNSDATDGNAIAVKGDGSIFENNVLIYSGTVPSGDWSGGGALTAGAGLTKTLGVLDVGDGAKGIQVNSNDLQLDASEVVSSTGGIQQVAGGGNEHLLEVKLDTTTGGGEPGLAVGANGLGLAAAAAGAGLAGGAGSALSVNASNGLEVVTDTVQLDLLASGGLKLTGVEVGVEPADFAGTGLEDDGSDNLRLSTQGTGIAGGAGSTLSIDTASTVTFSGATWSFPADDLQVTTTPDSANDAVNKAYVDSIASGVAWLEPVCCIRYIGNDTVANLNTAGGGFGVADAGKGYVVTDAGTLTLGSVSVTAGDIVEWDETQWVLLHDTASGFPADGTRMLVSDLLSDTLQSPLTDSTDESKIAEWDGASLTPTLTVPTEGDAALVVGDGGFNENAAYTYEASSNTWIQFNGAGQINAGAGLDKSGNTINVGSGDGVTINPNGIEVNASVLVGTGIEDDGSNNFRIAAQGNGLSGGGGTTLAVQADGDSISVSGSGVKASVPATANKDMTASVTTTDNDSATATTVAFVPVTDGHLSFLVNGAEESLGNGTKVGVAAYISGDGGTSARAWNDVVATDTFHWNGTVAGYELAATDRLSLNGNAAA